ncbi:MAG: tetratricopeptide repeat protein [Lachnospiraceae bacterium]|nr:tetratricopeptide repeat protein [Lachnospiraceae bacterium]
MFCIRCGNPIEDGGKFCTKCGAEIKMPGETPAEITAAAPAEVPIRKKSRLPLLLLLLIPLTGVIVFLVLIGFRKTEEKEDPYDRKLRMAARYLEELDYDRAIAAYQEAIEIDPSREEAYLGLADVYEEMEDYTGLISYLEQLEKSWDRDTPEDLPEDAIKEVHERLEMAYARLLDEAGAVNLTEALTMYGEARLTEDEEIVLTDLETWQSGSVWLEQKFNTKNGFAVFFSFQAGGGREYDFGGADGIVVTFADRMGLGGQGENLGFVEGSYGIEFDSFYYNDGDPEGKHIAFIDGSTSNHVSYVLDDRVDDSRWHRASVLYINNRMDLYVDGEKLLSEQVKLPDEVCIGITAATGDGMNHHWIKDFEVTEASLEKQQR